MNTRRALNNYERSLTMSNPSSTATAVGSVSFPIFGAAFAVLFVLKVAGLAGASWGLANLSWWWVISPLLISIAFSIFIIVIFLLILLGVAIFGSR